MLADAIGGNAVSHKIEYSFSEREILDRRGCFRLTKGGALGRSLKKLKVPTRGIYLLDERNGEHIH
jgi:hypothetical protein